MLCPTLILGLAVLALATVPSQKPGLAPKRLMLPTLKLNLDEALECDPIFPNSFGSTNQSLRLLAAIDSLHVPSRETVVSILLKTRAEFAYFRVFSLAPTI